MMETMATDAFVAPGRHIEDAVLVSRAERGSHDSSKGGHYKNQREV